MGNKSLKTSKKESERPIDWSHIPSKGKSDPSLFAAIDANDCHRMRQLLNNGHRINKRDANGLTALHLAAINGSEQCLQLLIEFKPQLVCCPLRQTALHFAAVNGTANMVNVLIDYGSVLNARDSMGSTPLAAAVDVNNIETAKALLMRGAVLHPNVCVSALQKGFSKLLQILLNFRPNIIKSIDLSEFCFTRVTVSGLKLLYSSGFDFNETIIESIKPLNWIDFCLSGRIRLPPEHYNRDLDFKAFDSFVEWLNDRPKPKSLKCLARIGFRSCCHQNNIEVVFSELNVPKVIKQYLLLNDIQ